MLNITPCASDDPSSPFAESTSEFASVASDELVVDGGCDPVQATKSALYADQVPDAWWYQPRGSQEPLGPYLATDLNVWEAIGRFDRFPDLPIKHASWLNFHPLKTIFPKKGHAFDKIPTEPGQEPFDPGAYAASALEIASLNEFGVLPPSVPVKPIHFDQLEDPQGQLIPSPPGGSSSISDTKVKVPTQDTIDQTCATGDAGCQSKTKPYPTLAPPMQSAQSNPTPLSKSAEISWRDQIGALPPFPEVIALAANKGCRRVVATRDFTLTGDQPTIIYDPTLLTSAAAEATSREALLNAYGEDTIKFTTGVSISQGSEYSQMSSSLRQFLTGVMRGGDRDTVRAFDFDWFKPAPRHAALAKLTFDEIHRLSTKGVLNKAEWSKQMVALSVGANQSTVPFHMHGPVLFGLFVGVKTFYLLPPAAPKPRVDGETSYSFSKWLNAAKEGKLSSESSDTAAIQTELMACTLLPGEVLYIPNMWQHATQDLTETFATSVLYRR